MIQAARSGDTIRSATGYRHSSEIELLPKFDMVSPMTPKRKSRNRDLGTVSGLAGWPTGLVGLLRVMRNKLVIQKFVSPPGEARPSRLYWRNCATMFPSLIYKWFCGDMCPIYFWPSGPYSGHASCSLNPQICFMVFLFTTSSPLGPARSAAARACRDTPTQASHPHIAGPWVEGD